MHDKRKIRKPLEVSLEFDDRDLLPTFCTIVQRSSMAARRVFYNGSLQRHVWSKRSKHAGIRNDRRVSFRLYAPSSEPTMSQTFPWSFFLRSNLYTKRPESSWLGLAELVNSGYKSVSPRQKTRDVGSRF